MRSALRSRLDGLYELAERKYRVLEYRHKAARRKKLLKGGFDCRREYRQTVVPYWRRFGVRPRAVWYRLFSFYSETVDPRYIPDDLWFDRILPYYSNSSFRRFGEDKNYHAVWCPEALRPKTVASQIAGVCYDDQYRIITKEEAARRCAECGRFVMKPSVDSGGGRLIRFFESGATREETLEAFRDFGGNWIAQEIVEQHETLEQLNPGSLNTLRIISFLFENEVHILSAILRVGGVGAKVDNIGAGGYACAVDEDGRLSCYSINRRSERCETTAGGVRFSNVVVPRYTDALALVKKLHVRMAHFKIIGWDIAIDRQARPVLIEFNTAPGQNQYSCGPTFGDLTEKVLTDVFLTKSLKDSKN